MVIIGQNMEDNYQLLELNEIKYIQFQSLVTNNFKLYTKKLTLDKSKLLTN